MSKQKVSNMNNFGKMIRKFRLDNELPLRVVAAHLEIDQAILSKFEHGTRKSTREHVVKLAEFFKFSPDELLVAWLADKVIYALEGDDDLALRAMQVAEGRVAYGKPVLLNTNTVLQQLKLFFKKDTRISSAWLFGSVARGEATKDSDIDVMIELFPNITFTMMDMLDLQFQLSHQFDRKVDVVEKGFVKDFAEKNVIKDLKLIIKK